MNDFLTSFYAGDEHTKTKLSVYPAGISCLTVMDHGETLDITMLVPVKAVDPVLSLNSHEVGTGQRVYPVTLLNMVSHPADQTLVGEEESKGITIDTV